MRQRRCRASLCSPWATLLVLAGPLLAPPTLLAQEVTLPLERYEGLRARAFPPPAPIVAPPVPVAVEAAFLDLAVAETSARLRLDLTLSLFDPGWQRVPLPPSGVWTGVELGGLEGRLEAGSELALVVRGAGRHTVRLSGALPLVLDEAASRPTRRLGLTLPRAARVQGSIEVPAEVEEITAAGPLLLAPAESGGRRGFVGAPGAAVTLTLLGAAVVPERERLPLRFETVSTTALEVARTRVRWHGRLQTRVLQGRLEKLVVALPAGWEVVGVEGAGLAGWDVVADRLEIAPAAPVTGELAVALELNGAPSGAPSGDAQTSFAVPTLVPEGSARTFVATKTLVLGDGLLDLEDPGETRPLDSRSDPPLPADFLSVAAPVLVLPAGARAPRWRVSWAEGTEVLGAQVDRLLVDVLAGKAGRAACRIWAEVRSTGAAELALALPPGAELIEAWRDGEPVVPGRAAGGWVVPLAADERRQVVFISALVPLVLPVEGELALPLPALSVPASRVEVRLSLPAGARYVLVEGGRVGRVGAVPSVLEPKQPSALARQLGAAVGALPAGWELLAAPAGFHLVEAGWSALSAAPEPLRLRVEPVRQKEVWR